VKWLKFLLVSILIFFAGINVFAQEFTVVVAPFEIISGFYKSDADTIEYLFTGELAKTKSIKVLDQSDSMFKEIIKRMDFELSDWSNPKKVAEFGKALNANAVVLVRMMMLGDERIITVRINNLNTEILAANDMVVKNNSEIRGKLPGFTAEIVDRLPKPPPPKKKGYDIGDTGPGGGIVYLKEGKRHMEYIELPGTFAWDEAKKAVEQFRGGGFSNWKLPTINEARFIGSRLSYPPYGYYWSSDSASPKGFKGMAKYYWWGSDFENDTEEKSESQNVLAIRTFSSN